MCGLNGIGETEDTLELFHRQHDVQQSQRFLLGLHDHHSFGQCVR